MKKPITIHFHLRSFLLMNQFSRLTLSVFIFLVPLSAINVIVTIPPQKTFVEKIGGDKVKVMAMIDASSNPHIYTPKPSQMRALSKAEIYFEIGIEDFENKWRKKFLSQNKTLDFVDMGKGVAFITGEFHHHHEEQNHENHQGEEHHDEHGEDEKHGHKEEGHHKEDEHKEHNDHHDEHAEEADGHAKDPHIWLSPVNIRVMADNIYQTLVASDPSNKAYFKRNHKRFLKEIDQTDKTDKKAIKRGKKRDTIFGISPLLGLLCQHLSSQTTSHRGRGKIAQA